jgi:hypothetical protein
MCVDPGHFDTSMNLQINYTFICENAIQLNLLNDWGIYFIQMFYDVTLLVLTLTDIVQCDSVSLKCFMMLNY